MAIKNQLRRKNVALYRLKRHIAITIVLRNTASTVDLATGVITPTNTDLTIKKAILLPRKMARKFVYDISYLAANKNFTYGGEFDEGNRFLIVDFKDIPSTFVLSNNTKCVFSNRVYQMISHTLMEENASYLIQLRETTNQPNDA